MDTRGINWQKIESAYNKFVVPPQRLDLIAYDSV